MKRIVQVLASAIVLTATSAQAQSFNITVSIATALAEGVEAARLHPNRPAPVRGSEFAISKFDKQMIDAFGKAWRRSGNGSSPVEGVVLILQMPDGSYLGKELGATNEHRQFTFRWQPGTIAVVHTHPNGADPKPQEEDIAVANKYHVPIFTITSRGMYVYDPVDKTLSKLMRDLDWLEFSKWSKSIVARQ